MRPAAKVCAVPCAGLVQEGVLVWRQGTVALFFCSTSVVLTSHDDARSQPALRDRASTFNVASPRELAWSLMPFDTSRLILVALSHRGGSVLTSLRPISRTDRGAWSHS